MRIGIDISMLVYVGSGVATYTHNLVKALLEFHPEHEYKLFYSSFRRPPQFNYLNQYRDLGAKVYDYRLPPRVLKYAWNKNHLLPVERMIGKVDVYHSSDYLRPPLSKNTKGTTTIHDLTWKIYPEFHTEDIVRAHERKLEKTIKYGDEIIVVSENTKKDLLKFYPEAERNGIHVIYSGVDDRFRPIKDKNKIATVLRRYGIKYPKRYLLYVGAIEPRKNLDTAIKAYSELIKDKDFADFEFLIVGRAGWKNEKIFQLVKDLKLESKVHFVGYVEDEDLPYFYNSAKVFVYLSKYEGFGLPPLEALKCHVPVIAFKNSSLKEILPSIYLLNKNMSNELLNMIKKFSINSPAIKPNDTYSWDSCAKNFIEIITTP